MPYLFQDGLTTLSSSLGVLELESFVSETPSQSSGTLLGTTLPATYVSSELDFKKLAIEYMNYEAQKYGYPDIFAAMSLKNSSISELIAEGASWSDFFDAGMTFIDYKIKTNSYLNYEKTIISIKNDPISPKVIFEPSLTFSSIAI